MIMIPACDDVRFFPTFAKEESPKASKTPFKMSMGQKSELNAVCFRVTHNLVVSKQILHRKGRVLCAWSDSRQDGMLNPFVKTVPTTQVSRSPIEVPLSHLVSLVHLCSIVVPLEMWDWHQTLNIFILSHTSAIHLLVFVQTYHSERNLQPKCATCRSNASSEAVPPDSRKNCFEPRIKSSSTWIPIIPRKFSSWLDRGTKREAGDTTLISLLLAVKRIVVTVFQIPQQRRIVESVHPFLCLQDRAFRYVIPTKFGYCRKSAFRRTEINFPVSIQISSVQKY